ncbi:unnamed protein product, partial [Nippostrongylus brasiliensis]|uniref:Large ribosomal subunit protein mL44 n=1 Tax=Nippostrongylus brasiliensis TaxID=27835 RepID=A0A0N4XK72_NIPBR
FRNYTSEVYAFGHRIGAADVQPEQLVKALTTSSFYTRPDIEENATDAAPSRSAEVGEGSNTELVGKGRELLSRVLSSYFRCHLPRAPEEFVQAVVEQLSSEEQLSNIAKHIGIDVLLRTAECPPKPSSIAESLQALLAVIGEGRAKALIVDMIIPQVIDVDFADVYPLREPLAVLTDILTQEGATEVEPRILRSSGPMSAQPVYVVGIYKDKSELVGQSAGETLEIAVDMAAREGLLRLWGVTADRVFFFGRNATEAPLENFTKPNYSLKDRCKQRYFTIAPITCSLREIEQKFIESHFSTDTSTEPVAEEEPLNIVEIAMRHREKVEAVVGLSYTKRLRHKFSRGSLAKRSFRYLVKPKVYTVS